MLFTIKCIVLPLVIIFAAAIIAGPQIKDPFLSFVIFACFVWLCIGARATKRYWRARWYTKGRLEETRNFRSRFGA